MPADDLTRMLKSATKGGGDYVTGKKAVQANEPEDEVAEDEDEALDDDVSEADPDEGESTEEETESDEEPSGDESDEGDEEAGDETSDETDESEDETEVAEDEAPEEEPAAPVLPPVDPRITLLEQQNARLMSLIANQQNVPVPTAPLPEIDDLPDQVARTAMFGTPQEVAQLAQTLTPEHRAKAQKLMDRHQQVQLLLARQGPAALFDAIQDRVRQEVEASVAPYRLAYEEQQTDRLISTHLGPVKDPDVRKRAVDIFRLTPGARSGSWQEREQALALSVRAAYGEKAQRADADQKAKNKAGKAQSQANGGKKLKPTGTKSGSKPKPKIPNMKPGESFERYAKRIAPLMQDE